MYTATTFSGLVSNIITQMQPIGAVLVGLALVYFIWGVAQVVLNAGDETKLEEGKKTMLWGVIALFVMVSLWGLATALSGSFGLQDTKVDKVDYVAP
ncbi:MAG TPA: hypothetical protein VJK09_01885 [Candidatus Paceibacterota bacterium]